MNGMSSKFNHSANTLATTWSATSDVQKNDSPETLTANQASPPGQTSAPPIPPPAVHALDDEPAEGLAASQSMLLMAAMFNAIFNTRYGRGTDFGVMPLERDDGTFGMGLHPAEPTLEEDGSLDVFSDPDFHDAAQEFLTDLDQFTVDNEASVYFDAVGLIAPTKLDLFHVLSAYILDPEFAMTTPDTIFVKDDIFDENPFIARQQRAHMQDQHAAKARQVLESPTNIADILYVVNNSPYSSLKDFHAACFACSYADLPIALTHIYQTICQEDGLDPESHPNVKVGLRPTLGGYN